MQQFTFNMPTKVLFGFGQLNHLHEENLDYYHQWEIH